MNPSDAHSSLATLRQLKEMLDAGTLTPQEFETLKQQLVFGQDAAKPAPAASPTPAAPAAPSEAGASVPSASPPVALPEVPRPPAPVAPAAWQAAPAPVLPPVAAATPPADIPERRNPLTLVFAIGGALLLLALVLYLALGGQGADEHLTSTSRTAADSTNVAPEIGPQAQQLALPTAPETIRVAPAAPLPAAPVPARFRTDSATATTAAAPQPAPATATTAPTKAKAAEPAKNAAVPADSVAAKTSQP